MGEQVKAFLDKRTEIESSLSLQVEAIEMIKCDTLHNDKNIIRINSSFT